MQKIGLDRREIAVWSGVVAALVLLGLVVAVTRKTATREETVAHEDPYRAEVAKADPAEYRAQRAYAYEASGAYSIAADEYRKLLEKNPDDGALHGRLATLNYKMGDMDGTIAETREVLRIEPGDWDQRESLADLLFARGDYDSAAAEYEESLRSNTDNPACRIKLGRVHYLRGRYAMAEEQFNKSADNSPLTPEACLGLGLCALARGDTAVAMRQKELLNKDGSPLALVLEKAIAAKEASSPMPEPTP